MEDTYLTPNQILDELACQGISLSPATIYNNCTSGRLPSKKIGRKRFILRSDFVKWIEGSAKN